MTKLKLFAIPDDKPVKLTIELPAPVFRDLQAYAAILARDSGEASSPDPARLIAPMIARFMETDRGFAKAKRGRPAVHLNPSTGSEKS
ncbi:DUF2274 domain-containing protein [Sinorhizobium meliloti]|uniref:DUF2274 domain-containing protein n=1 Tax=Rhizobium meliloti TaxID=382 RepID=UPI000FD1E11E|nr:DUF2274 domain-containing protein [Sinorhizobium meliloti]RVI10289.1 DUF2274 domain-containing protein [Sinorhizobium meliloti]RVN81312.1 DUF2274 domain-containing protein [Sinorhizobium meliloti]RVO03635.1 DUF2274 domain-containing protein [Sinorhizobium meliloti]